MIGGLGRPRLGEEARRRSSEERTSFEGVREKENVGKRVLPQEAEGVGVGKGRKPSREA